MYEYHEHIHIHKREHGHILEHTHEHERSNKIARNWQFLLVHYKNFPGLFVNDLKGVEHFSHYRYLWFEAFRTHLRINSAIQPFHLQLLNSLLWSFLLLTITTESSSYQRSSSSSSSRSSSSSSSSPPVSLLSWWSSSSCSSPQSLFFAPILIPLSFHLSLSSFFSLPFLYSSNVTLIVRRREGQEQCQGEGGPGCGSGKGTGTGRVSVSWWVFLYDTYSEAANTMSLLMHCETASIFLDWSKSNRVELKIKSTEKTERRGRRGRTEVREESKWRE